MKGLKGVGKFTNLRTLIVKLNFDNIFTSFKILLRNAVEPVHEEQARKIEFLVRCNDDIYTFEYTLLEKNIFCFARI